MAKKSDRKKFVWEKAGGKCAHCGKETPESLRTVDHVLPQSVGGGDDPRNLMPLCKRCNGTRENKKIDFEEFYGLCL